jgi:PKD repeat protein
MNKGRKCQAAIGAVVLVALCLWAQTASAVLVRAPSGQFLGVTPHAGVAPASIPGSVAAQHAGKPNVLSGNGNLDYHNGPVIHSSAPYLIFWDPASGITANSRSLFERYFADLAANSGKSTNVYAVNRQFTDSTGFADYRQTFITASQAISDTHAYPSRDRVNCADVAATYPSCLTDTQLQTELGRLIATGLPQGTATNAPLYFIVTPGTVNICANASTCADTPQTGFCAYHSSFANGSNTVLYATIPMFFNGASTAQNPKFCQVDGNTQVQEPNANIADVAIKYLSHEDSETITDPLGTGWWDTNSGNEDGDNCNVFGSFFPSTGSNPSAFKPSLGGTAAAGNLRDQLINGNPYYIQTEWSNGDVNCEAQPSAGAIRPSFTVSGPLAAGNQLTFDPAASSSSRGYTSVTWHWGDRTQDTFGAGSSAPVVVHHTFASPGQWQVALTLVDAAGNLATVTMVVPIVMPPAGVFTASPTRAVTGSPVFFDASGSSDPNAATISSYQWDFGDGSTGTGLTPGHTYASPGTYTVSLTVTDSIGFSSTPVTHQITVIAAVALATPAPASGSRQVTIDELPTAHIAVKTAHPAARVPVAFDGSGSVDPDGSIVAYSWSFGDGSASASGAAPRHAYARAGIYVARLTAIDSSGGVASTTSSVRVAADSKIARTSISSTKKGRFLLVKVDGAGVVRVGSAKVTLKRPGTASFRIALTSSGRRTLRQRHKLSLKLTVTYVPVTGPTVTKKLTVVVRS